MSNYSDILVSIFLDKHTEGCTSVPFERTDMVNAANKLEIDIPKNLGDVVYSYRFRASFPPEITETAPEGMEWVIRLKGTSTYAFELTKQAKILPNDNLITIKIPDSTPEIISGAARDDEQALLAKVRYNRLIDIFLGLTAYSLQNHLRTVVPDIGQIEVDEIYIAIDQHGRQYVIPVEAKGSRDELGTVQTEQDLAVCFDKWNEYIPIAVGIQFMADDSIAMFELTMQENEVRVAKECHYRLVPNDQITEQDRELYTRQVRDEQR